MNFCRNLKQIILRTSKHGKDTNSDTIITYRQHESMPKNGLISSLDKGPNKKHTFITQENVINDPSGIKGLMSEKIINCCEHPLSESKKSEFKSSSNRDPTLLDEDSKSESEPFFGTESHKQKNSAFQELTYFATLIL